MAKRSREDQCDDSELPAKKARNTRPPMDGTKTAIMEKFRLGLLDPSSAKLEKDKYHASEPYKHGVIRGLMSDILLENVLDEIKTKIHFTPKETDIYRIHQSGDLANLDGLPDSALKELPALLDLRNALYSAPFREYLAEVTGSGPLSGTKTDMAINVYLPGCHLLCHDDVIGTRRVSYILYLTKEWKSTWGGALRLYPTKELTRYKKVKGYKQGNILAGEVCKVPNTDPVKSIYPEWNQLSFFAVQPGESYHDVEEVYSSKVTDNDTDGKDDARIRIAISGWYHIPQEGEECYVPGLAERLTEKSSLQQLESKFDDFDLPKAGLQTPYFAHHRSKPGSPPEVPVKKGHSRTPEVELFEDPNPDILTEKECEFLLQYMNPRYLTPDFVAEMEEEFGDASAVRLEDFLNPKFAKLCKDAIEADPMTVPQSSEEVEKESVWTVAQPPHKQRYLYVPRLWRDQDSKRDVFNRWRESNPISKLLCVLFPSLEFRKWLRLSTGLVLKEHNLRARRFRRGYDYQLATPYKQEDQRLEMTLGISPSGFWESPDPEENGEENHRSDVKIAEVNNGGDEVYMAAEDDLDEESDEQSVSSDDSTSSEEDSSAENTSKLKKRKTPLPVKTKPAKKQKLDPAVYQAAPDSGEDDDILFSMPAGWNRLSLVIRDRGTLKFVKYVSASAMADRWDITGEFGVDWERTDAEVPADGLDVARESEVLAEGENGGDGGQEDEEDEEETDVESGNENGNEIGHSFNAEEDYDKGKKTT